MKQIILSDDNYEIIVIIKARRKDRLLNETLEYLISLDLKKESEK